MQETSTPTAYPTGLRALEGSFGLGLGIFIFLGAVTQWDAARILHFALVGMAIPFLVWGLLSTLHIPLLHLAQYPRLRTPPLPALPEGRSYETLIRTVPIYRDAPPIRVGISGQEDKDFYDIRDLDWLCREVVRRGPSWPAFQNTVLPSGLRLDHHRLFDPFIEQLERTRCLTGRRPGTPGTLVITDPDELRRRLLPHPDEYSR